MSNDLHDWLKNASPETRAANAHLLQETAVSPKRHKYNAQPTIIDGIRFDSKKEARRYVELNQMQAQGLIHDLALQPRFELLEAFTDKTGKRHRAINYTADFEYREGDNIVIEDVKGVETAVFKIKRKLFCKKYFMYELRIT